MSATVTGTEEWEDIPHGPAHYKLRLFVAGASTNSIRAISNLKAILTEHLDGRYDLEVIDVRLDAEAAQREQIIALPMLIKDAPLPSRRLIGDMSDTARVLRGMGLLD